MRDRFVVSMMTSLLTVAACGGGGSGNNPGDDDGTPDAAVEEHGDLEVPDQGFQVVTPYLSIAPGEETTKCFHTTLATGGEVAVHRWESQMTTGSHHMILYFVNSDSTPNNTITEGGCGLGSSGGGFNFPVWTFSSGTPHHEQSMPDGVAMPVPHNQKVVIEMHYLNTTDAAIDARVTLNGETLADGTQYQRAAAYVTFNQSISIPAGTPQNPAHASAEGSCDVPEGAKFYTLSTHTHKQGVGTQVYDGATGDDMIFSSTDWEHPGEMNWTDAPNFTFANGKLRYHCDYENPNAYTIHTGNSAQTDEMCMAVGYFYPATGSKLCLDSSVLF